MSNLPIQPKVSRDDRVRARAKTRSMTEQSADTQTQPLAPPIEGVREPISDLSPTGVEESLIHTNEVDGDAPPKALHANEMEGIYPTL